MLNHSIEGRKLFLDSQDYARFVHNLYEFNDAAPAVEFSRADVGPPRSYIRKRLVEIHGWCLMKDHYHLLISELVKGGMVKFMMKVNVGSTNEVKVKAVTETFKDYSLFINSEFNSFNVKSDVSEQPKSLDETIKGANNRAKNAFQNCRKKVTG